MIPVEEAETQESEQFGPEDGVIEEARERQRRRRRREAGALLAAAAVGFAVLLAGGQAGRTPSPPPVRLTSSPRFLTGSPLRGMTHLRLLASADGAVYSVDVDSATVRHLAAIPAGREYSTQLLRFREGALAIVTHTLCSSCNGVTNSLQTTYRISAAGSVARLATIALARHQSATAAYDSTASWVQTWPHRGPCTLRARAGQPPGGADALRRHGRRRPRAASGSVNGDVEMLVDPFTGACCRRLTTTTH